VKWRNGGMRKAAINDGYSQWQSSAGNNEMAMA